MPFGTTIDLGKQIRHLWNEIKDVRASTLTAKEALPLIRKSELIDHAAVTVLESAPTDTVHWSGKCGQFVMAYNYNKATKTARLWVY